MRLTPPLAIVLLLAGGALAQGEGSGSFTLVGHLSGGAYFWTLENATVRNPDLVVPPHATVHVRVLNDGASVHNLQVDGFPPSGYVSVDNPETQYSFAAPASGVIDYWCQPHKSVGMAGRVVVAGTDVEPRETAGVGALGALLVVVLAALRTRA